MIFKQIKPYLQIIRIVTYMLLASFLFVGGCNYGKHKQTVRVAELETALGVSTDANLANLKAIEILKQANAEYASQSAKHAKDAVNAQESLKRAQKRIKAQEKAFTKELNNAYKKNPDWSSQPVPADIKRLFERTDQDWSFNRLYAKVCRTP